LIVGYGPAKQIIGQMWSAGDCGSIRLPGNGTLTEFKGAIRRLGVTQKSGPSRGAQWQRNCTAAKFIVGR